jgi:three-Cys-motif partner protein
MGAAKYHEAADGWPARIARSWTQEKLMVLEAYLPRFAQACSRKARGWWAIDGFAGAGLNWSDVQQAEIHGSALLLCEAGPPRYPAAERVLLCEQHDELRAALEERTRPYGDRAQVSAGDINEEIHQLLERVPRRAPTFAFLDPEGADVAWSTVRALADHKRNHHRFKIEQLILFPTDTGFMRLLSRDQLSAEGAGRVRRMMPDGRFRQVWADRGSGRISPAVARARYVEIYEGGLRELGYETVLSRAIRRGEDNRIMYYLVFATDNQAGKNIMQSVFSQVHMRVAEQLGQLSF